MSVHNDECLSKILLQLKFQAIILKDYWPLKGLVRSQIFLCLCSIVFIFIRENNWKRFLSYLRVLAQTDYPLHTSLIKLISIIVRPGRGRFECIVFLTSTYSSSSSGFVDFHVRVSLKFHDGSSGSGSGGGGVESVGQGAGVQGQVLTLAPSTITKGYSWIWWLSHCCIINYPYRNCMT